MKKITPILLTIIAILFVATLYLLYLNLNKSSASVSTPTGVPLEPIEKVSPSASVDETATWKTYISEQYSLSFKYPENNQTVCFNNNVFDLFSKEDVGSNAECAGIVYQIPIMGFSEYFVGLSTQKPISQRETTVDNISITVKRYTSGDNLTQIDIALIPLKGKTINFYGYSNSSRPDFSLYDRVLSTIKFTESLNSEKGTVTGNLCYPSEGIPPGTIIAKNVSTGETFSQKYNGTAVDPSSKFSFSLSQGTYHFKFELGNGLSGYYNKCAKTMDSVDCNPPENHDHLNVIVNSNKTTAGISICDFYYSSDLQPKLQSTF